MAIVFDGKNYAFDITSRIATQVKSLGGTIKLSSIYNSRDEGSRIYTKIKAKKADEIGVLFEGYDVSEGKKALDLVRKLNNDSEVSGVMVQLPLTGNGRWDERIIREITKTKDVDGLNEKSQVVPATVRAVEAILARALEEVRLNTYPLTMVIVGNLGNVGKRLEKEFVEDVRFKILGMNKNNFDVGKLMKADVIISATGNPGIINNSMIKPDVVLIDVGYPEGDMLSDVQEKASFWTPVPGGVGPVTVAMLYKNLIDLVYHNLA